MRSVALKDKRIKSNRVDRIFSIFNYLFAAAFLLIILYPVYFVIIASFSNPYDVAGGRVWLWPVNFTLAGYEAVFKDSEIWIGYRNTILYTVLGTLFGLAVNLPAAYALSRRDLVGQKYIMLFFVFTMFFNGGLIPTYLTIKEFGLLDNFLVMIIPFAVSVYNIIVARTFFSNNISQEMLEAAQIDGCGNVRFFVQIVLPLSKAIIAVIALWTAVGHWNSYFNALIYIQDSDLYPLQLILRNILITNLQQSSAGLTQLSDQAMQTGMIMRYAVVVISTVPIMCVYPFIQKHFNQGVMIGAIKG
ncbi:MAG: carbohydrate ABC transporter permease [Clostridia bacterium]|nr:carbohydrate ABC transporter permease [Clostridia bacterium]